MTETGRILAIDYGKRRVGLAISDPTRSIAFPLKTIDTKKSPTSLEKQVASIILQYEVSEVIVGLPLTEQGLKGDMALEVEGFVSDLKARIDCRITMWDERFSSVRAIRAIHEMGEKTGKDKGKVDMISAVFILQNYLDAISGDHNTSQET
jgi:putative Holliday junction resolvase